MHRRVVHRSQDLFDARPLVLLALLFAVLAATRIAGAWAQTLMVVSVALGPLTLLVVRPEVRAEIGLVAVRDRRALLRGTAVVVAAYALTSVGCLLAIDDPAEDWVTQLPTIFDEMAPGRHWLSVLLMIVCMGVLVPVAEEVFYRGVLYSPLERRGGPAVAIGVTALLWTGVHVGDYGLNPYDGTVLWGMLASVLVMGIALGICRRITGSVLASILAQGTANLLLLVWAVQR